MKQATRAFLSPSPLEESLLQSGRGSRSGARRSKEEPGEPGEPGGARRSQESQEEPGEPGGARRSQEEPPGSSCVLLALPGAEYWTHISSNVDTMREFQGAQGRARRKAQEDQETLKQLGGPP